ncbi:MAG: primosomal protein N', partial [Clostridia bacterium]|nr:primosomal protein N' [Clostridia bacterium]
MYAQVIVDISNDAVDRVFDYVALPNTQVGMRVSVPFANRAVLGYVVALTEDSNFDKTKIKSIISNKESVAKIKPEILEVCKFLARHFFLRLSDCIKLVLPSCVRLDSQNEQNIFMLSSTYDFDTAISIIGKRAKSQLSAFAFIQEQGEIEFSRAVEMFGRSAINALIEKGIVLKTAVRKMRAPEVTNLEIKKHPLTKLQQNAVNTILGKDKTFLLQGVTGSGKTEVYMSIIENALKENKTAIMLVPEISLTPQMMQRFNARFPNQIAVLHSGLSEGERFDEWDRIFKGEAKVVLGARSAIFAPLENLGVIIIDEEHDNSYVSESNPRFITHDVAEFRARYNKCPLVLGSATPNISSFKKAQTGEYTLVQLPERINGLEMPHIEVVDMLNEVLDGNTSCYSRVLLSKLEECVKNKKQAILFINRRGFAS